MEFFKESKNQNFLIDVAKILSNKYKLNFIMLLIGEGPMENKLKNRINDLNLNNYIKIINNIKNDNLYQTIISCDLYLSSSVTESFGLSVLDALYLDKKVLVSNIPISKEIINNEHSDFISELNEEVFAKNIVSLINTNYGNISKLYLKDLAWVESIELYRKTIQSLL